MGIEERRERRRLATQRYRERHKKELAHARTVARIMLRQTWRDDDIAQFAAALRATFTKEAIAELCRELQRS